jgi:hypothetical protein
MKREEDRTMHGFERKELHLEELDAILERSKSGPLCEGDLQILKGAVQTLAFLTRELERKGISIQRLRDLLFGASTEKTSHVLGKAGEQGASTMDQNSGSKRTPEEKVKGHGRNGAAAYTGAVKIKVHHTSMKTGDGCSACGKGKIYPQKDPAILLRVIGMAPIQATIYEADRLRCNLCGKVFQAEAPDGAGKEKYDESVSSMIGVLKYGCGLPFNRIERLQAGMEIPLPAATQWELVEKSVDLLLPAYTQLVWQAAQGTVIHNDDTTMKILQRDIQGQESTNDEMEKRTGTFTSGILSKKDGREIALYFTGGKHAGENLVELLTRREKALAMPIQMCDALSRNMPKELATIVANCLAHARRRFVEVVANFPQECRHVLEILSMVYRHDAETRKQSMSAQDRLLHHQEKSAPLMRDLEVWMREQIQEKKVESNSGLGEAIQYMLKHWARLTLFLREPGAPLDNNICERALKKAILHRKNSLFYKTENGARVGDIFMSLIYTAEINKASPFDYLVQIQRNAQKVKATPADWMPWNYRETLLRASSGSSPPR